jgi:glycopeptide antibiotics resistance protein
MLDTTNKTLRGLLWFTLIIYLLVLTKFIVFKQPPSIVKDQLLHHYSWKAAKANMHKANLTLFATIKLYWNSNLRATYKISNLLGNIVGFVPLGILFPLLSRRLRTFPRTVFMVFLFSLAFELFQLFTMLGICDIDDLLLNTIGGMIGYLIFLILGKLVVIK